MTRDPLNDENSGDNGAASRDELTFNATDQRATAREDDREVDTETSDRDIERRISHISRRSFMWGALAAAGAMGGWHWLNEQRLVDGTLWPLRLALEANENLARDYFKGNRLAPMFRRELATMPRPNGDIGLDSDIDASTWRLHVTGLTHSARQNDLSAANAANSGDDKKSSDNTSVSSDGAAERGAIALTLQELMRLPRTEIVTELKCIEGWSNVVHWVGVRFADFTAHYGPTMVNNTSDPPVSVLPEYVAMETPDGSYYVGLDIESAMHPQTLLCYEMNGEPLAPEHGAPLRLVIPVKYGIKHIKRIGLIRFTDDRPKDYWAQQGYDWYAGH